MKGEDSHENEIIYKKANYRSNSIIGISFSDGFFQEEY